MNPYCRRAVAQGVTLARDSGGTCTVVTLGPPGAEDVLREAVAWGADAGLHACDAAFAGSDTLATARALAAVLRAAGPFDLVLLGRNSIDGETGQVGPELAELLDLPFASGVRELEDRGPVWRLRARARRRDAGGRDLAARRDVGGRAPLRPLQGGPRGPGRRAVGAPRPDELGPAGPGALGRSREPDGGRRHEVHGARPRPARPAGTARHAGRRGGARARQARCLDGARPGPGRCGPRGARRGTPPWPRPEAGPEPFPGDRRPGRARPPRLSEELLGAAAQLASEAARRCTPSARVPVPRLPSRWRRPAPTSWSCSTARPLPRTWPMPLPPSSGRGHRGPCSPPAPRSAVRWRAAPPPPRARDWWATPSPCRSATAPSWRPSRRSPAHWWPTSPAAAPRRWSRCARASCPSRRRGPAWPRW